MFRRRCPLVVLLATVAFGWCSSAWGDQQFELHSKALAEQRQIRVYLPRDYTRSRQRYPVLVMLDGNLHASYAAAVADYLAISGRAPELIVVTVSSMRQRARDMTIPWMLEEAPKDSRPHAEPPGAAAFLRFLADEMLPWLDANYRTQPYRILSGHSLGGLINFYALLERPDAFQAHIAASPSLWWDRRAWVKQAQARIARLPGKHRLYFSWGDEDEGLRESNQELAAWMGGQKLANLRWRSHYYPNEEHGSTPLRTLYDGLEWLYADWRFQDVDALTAMDYGTLRRTIADHYAGLSQRLGYSMRPDSGAQRVMRLWLMSMRERDDRNIEESLADLLVAFPEMSGEIHEKSSEVADAQNRPAEALAEYQKALAIYSAAPRSWSVLWREYGSERASQYRLQELKRKAAQRAAGQ